MKLKAASGIMLTLLLIGMLILTFNIQPVEASGTIYIKADGSVDPDTAPIASVDNITYTFTDNIYDEIVIERDNIVVDGTGYILQGTGNGKGIELTGRSNVTIKTTTIKNFAYGIYLWYSSNNSLSGNNITTNNWAGIYIDYSYNNRISGNKITANNSLGIDLYGASNNALTGNNITTNNCEVIRLGYSSDNIIYHNNFVGNSGKVYSYSSTNVWDDGYPSGGNYWSDHVCTGNPSDGSQPYVIDADNIDHYPFQDPNSWLLPPPEYTLTIHSSPTGVTFTVDGVFHATPWSGTYSEGASVSLVMPKTHNGYVWSHWLENGDTDRIKTVTIDTDITLTAVYKRPTPVGGKATPINIPTNKPETPALWIWLSTIILSLSITVVYVKKRKRHTESTS